MMLTKPVAVKTAARSTRACHETPQNGVKRTEERAEIENASCCVVRDPCDTRGRNDERALPRKLLMERRTGIKRCKVRLRDSVRVRS